MNLRKERTLHSSSNTSDNDGSQIVSAALNTAEDRLRSIAEELGTASPIGGAAEWLSLRASIGRTLAALNDSLSGIDNHFELTSARKRMLTYLLANLGRTVTKNDLSGVAGISEWARRIRELREDEGWLLNTNTTDSSMTPGEYRLVAKEPQPEVIYVWAAAKSAAKLKTRGGALDPPERLLRFLHDIYPRAAALDQLRHVLGNGNSIADCVVSLERRGQLVEHIAPDDLLCPGGLKAIEPALDRQQPTND